MTDKEKTAEITRRIEIMQEGVVADNFLKIKEFRLGSGYDGYSQQRCDVFAISPNKGNKTICYEVKVSRSDFKNDIKKEDDERNNIIGGIDANRLRSIIERVERLQEEKDAITSDIRDVFAKAKSAGFDVKILRAMIKLRKMNAADRDEQEYFIEIYRKALDI